MTGLLPRRFLPVLMYHRVGPPGDGDPALTVSPEIFERHLEWIDRRGFRALSLDAAHAALAAGTTPRRAVLLTIDDGFEETLGNAATALSARGMTAAVFVPAALVGRDARLAPSYGGSGVEEAMTGRIAGAEALERWIAAGNDVGSHSLTHADMTELSDEEAEREATESKSLLENLLGRAVPDFCYPYAHHGGSQRRAVRAAGYRAAYAGEPPSGSLWAVPRMMVYPKDSERRFARKLSGYYYWLSAWHRRVGGGGGGRR